VKRFKVIALAPAAAIVMLIGLSGPAGAAEPPGRAASTGGLGNATLKIKLTDLLISARPLEQVSLNFGMAQDPDQPGVTPGGGGVEP
jgi:hypothetical protein